MLEQLHHALKPIKMDSKALGNRDATLVAAAGSLKFMFKKLDKQQ